ncbi:hypothetical protein AB1Y20_006571 [Prymnesium parvum]|uniref:THIF-type NAD/FAD binding fold domain-containing protein n=1 Tax=Prymnesium parvum TaxID=97485 RepID=A0AB34J264_PRYPA
MARVGVWQSSGAVILLGLVAATFVSLRRRKRRPPDESAARHARTAAIHQLLPFVRLQDAAECRAEEAHDEEEVLLEQLSRNRAFLGDLGQDCVESAFVVVLGVGGAGSHAAQLLGRTGVGRLRLVDFGRVVQSSLQTHAVATWADIGALKVEVTRRALQQVVPRARVEAMAVRVDERSVEACLAPDADCVLLCLPEVETLAVALAACLRLRIPAIPILPSPAASLGAAGSVARQRVSLLHDVCSSIEARQLVARLRVLLHAQQEVSTPTAYPEPLPAAAQTVIHSAMADAAADLGAAGDSCRTEDGASHALRGPVLAGLAHTAASACLSLLAGYPLLPTPGIVSRNGREDLYRALQRRERDVFGSTGPLAVWPEDLEFLMSDVWGRRCALTGAFAGGEKPLVFTRWDRNATATTGNLVLLTKAAAEEHDQTTELNQLYGDARAAAIRHALRDAHSVSQRWR